LEKARQRHEMAEHYGLVLRTKDRRCCKTRCQHNAGANARLEDISPAYDRFSVLFHFASSLGYMDVETAPALLSTRPATARSQSGRRMGGRLHDFLLREFRDPGGQGRISRPPVQIGVTELEIFQCSRHRERADMRCRQLR